MEDNKVYTKEEVKEIYLKTMTEVLGELQDAFEKEMEEKGVGFGTMEKMVFLMQNQLVATEIAKKLFND